MKHLSRVFSCLFVGIFLLSGFCPLAFSQVQGPIHLIFDLDGTLIHEAIFLNRPEEHYIRLQSETYEIAPGAPLLLEALSENPEVRISYFSAGSAERNMNVLKSFKLPSGRTAFDLSLSHGAQIPRIYSWNEVEKIPIIINETTFYKCSKDVTVVKKDGEPFHLAQAILIEDRKSFMKEGQDRNFFHVYAHRSEVEPYRGYQIQNFDFGGSTHLGRFFWCFSQALERARSVENLTLADALQETIRESLDGLVSESRGMENLLKRKWETIPLE